MIDRHPVVGSWRVSVTVPGATAPTINLATFSLDGSMLAAFPSPVASGAGAGQHREYWTPALGSWSPAGERAATLTFITLGSDENGASTGTHVMSSTITAGADGQTWTGSLTIVFLSPNGDTLGTDTGTMSATRITTWVASI